MCSNYFPNLISQARQLDEGIEKLITTWNLPHVLIGRFGEYTSEINSEIEATSNMISNTQGGIKEILANIEEYKIHDSVTMEQFIQETKEEYEALRAQCSSLDYVLAECGYHYDEDNSLNQTHTNDNGNCNQNLVKELDNSDVESVRQFNDSCLSNIYLTPGTTRLASVLEDSYVTHKEYVCTPLRERPEEPIYSKHFYNLFKK